MAPAQFGHPPATRPARVRRRASYVVWLLPVLALPVATDLAGVDWLLPPIVLLLTTSLIRSGRTLLDRLVIALTLLLGTWCAVGLLVTVWPFGLSPTALAVAALVALVVAAAATERRPQLPRPTASDATLAAAALGVAVYFARPLLRTDATGRLALTMSAEDNARHLPLFHAVRRLGGYVFGQPADAVAELYLPMRYYPQGWHLTAGMLDGFLRSSPSDLGTPTSEVDHYLAFAVAGYGLLVLAVLWAVRWVAGPLLTYDRQLPVVMLLATLFVYSDLPTLLMYGYVAEVLGLAMLALLTAVLARRLAAPREHLVVICALMVGIGYTYYLFLPAAALAVGVWLARHRARLGDGWTPAVSVTAAAGLVAAVPLAIGVLWGGQSTLLSSPAGGGSPTSRAALLALAAFVAAGLATLAGRRMPIWRSYRAVVLCVGAASAALTVVQVNQAGRLSYYSEKLLHAMTIVLLVGVGAVVLLLPRPRRVARPLPRLVQAVPAVTLAVAIPVGMGAAIEDSPYRPHKTGAMANAGRLWASGRLEPMNRDRAELVMAAADRVVPTAETATVILSEYGFTDYQMTLWLGVLQRNSGSTAEVLYGVPNGLAYAGTPEAVEEVLLRTPLALRVIALTPAATRLVADMQARHPQRRIELVGAPR